MTNNEIMKIALQQSAYDCNCKAEVFLSDKNLITISKANPKARRYVHLPLECDLVTYGNNIVAQTSEELKDVVAEYISRFTAYRCFETPNLNLLNDMLKPFDLKVCFMALYYLPDVTLLKEPACKYELKVLQPENFSELYEEKEKWNNCLTFDDKEKDKLCVGAYHKGKLVGLAGCSADSDTMYQIGVDVLPEYRRQGIASTVTSKLALEILKMGKVPFYCTAWSNIRSAGNAFKCGFYPAWAELTARKTDFVNGILNG